MIRMQIIGIHFSINTIYGNIFVTDNSDCHSFLAFHWNAKTPHYREPILYLTFISTELYNFYTLYGAVSLIPLYIFWHSFLVLSLISAFPLAYDNCRHYYRNSEQKRDCRVWEPIQGV